MTYPATMALQITIGGVDMTAHVDPASSTISNVLTRQVDTASLRMFNVGGLSIQEWMEVIITDLNSSTKLFGGYVQQGWVESADPSGTNLIISPLSCADYSCLL